MGLLSVIVDVREPSWCQQLTFGGASVAVAMLDAGDLLCATDDGALLSIERKEAGDLLNTLRDDRLFPQIERLRQVSPWAYLVVVGDLRPGPSGTCFCDGRTTGWNWASVQGALVTCQELGVSVVQVGSDTDYEATVLRLANRSREPLRVAPARDVTIVGEQEQILAALPGIGAERAATLLRQFSPAMAIAWLTTPGELWEPPIAIPGIGDGTRRKVRRALGLGEDLSLDIVIHKTHEGGNGK
ncbi:MAG: hypothetical protein M0T85_15720 [Dehalococcoidales bacterium]|nr:hypothetical protein [Dehalococcoidales bacterium]